MDWDDFAGYCGVIFVGLVFLFQYNTTIPGESRQSRLPRGCGVTLGAFPPRAASPRIYALKPEPYGAGVRIQSTSAGIGGLARPPVEEFPAHRPWEPRTALRTCHVLVLTTVA